ncbi:MAG TPA: hypothetical protein VHO69_09170 [Phototrophicaceae bacterium]|nr:hypothetical protein [Phototrophicaceae bacterium]
MSDDARYEEILRRIQQRQQQAENAPQQAALSDILDGLNALGFLEDRRRKRPRSVNAYGPKAFHGYGPPVWAGAVLWYKPRNYYEYRTLYLLGIWAISGDPVTVTIGLKTLPFTAPTFSPESYYFHLKRRFDIYYSGDATPPPESDRRYTTPYDATRRLELRATIETALAEIGLPIKG